MKLYYHDTKTDEHVDSPDPLEANLEELLAKWDGLSRQQGTFLGVICESGESLQFLWDDPSSVLIDLPRPKRRGSLTKSSTYEECRQALIDAYHGSNPAEIAGLEFVSWG